MPRPCIWTRLGLTESEFKTQVVKLYRQLGTVQKVSFALDIPAGIVYRACKRFGVLVYHGGQVGHKVSANTRQLLRNKTLQRIRSGQQVIKQNTDIELILQQELRKEGIQFSTQVPVHYVEDTGLTRHAIADIFIQPNIVIFADGCYWHGCATCVKKYRELAEGRGVATPRETKVLQAIPKNNQLCYLLTEQDKLVFRFWGHEIKKDVNNCVQQVRSML